MKLTRKVALEVVSHEAIIRQAYKDSVGVWTWSAGLTNNSGHNVERYIDNPQPMSKCLEVYFWALRRYADDVRIEFRGHDLTEAQFAAALSFHWNTGAIGRASWVKHFKAGDVVKAKKAFMNWVKPIEITERRKKERDLFFNEKWSGDGRVTEYTRLTSKRTPNWGSRKRIDVSREIDSLVNRTPPKPLSTPQAHDTDPTADKPPKAGPIGIFAGIFTAIFKAIGRK